jgi:hypothetical protein
MDNILNEDLKKQFDRLPAEIQRAILDTNLSEKLQQITKNNKLMIDQAGSLQIETILVLLGLQPLNNYINNVKENVGLSDEQAKSVAKSVDELIFVNIRESLKKINEESLGGDIIEEKIDINNLEKGSLVSGIENPSSIKETEQSISVSSLESNNEKIPSTETFTKGIEVRKEISSEIPKGAILPPKPLIKLENAMFHDNLSPIEKNIVETKKETDLIIPKETIIIEEKTKLPEKPKIDPYRETTI